MTKQTRLPLYAMILLLSVSIFNSCRKDELNEPPPGTKIYFDQYDGASMGFVLGAKWNKTDLTWYVEKWCNSLSETETRDLLNLAFTKWADVSPLNFTEVSSVNEADIVISFGDNQHWTHVTNDWCPTNFDVEWQNYGVLAHAYYPTPAPLAGDLHFCDLHQWSPYGEADNSSVSMLSVAIHEIGHTIGIGHSSDINSIMYATYDPQHIKYDLGQDDIAAVQALYGIGGNPSSSISISGNVPSGVEIGSYQDFDLVITNIGTNNVSISNYSLTNSMGAFSVVSSTPNFPLNLAPNGTHNVTVRFSPTNQSMETSNFIVTSNAAGGISNLFLSGNGVAAQGPIFYPFPAIGQWTYPTYSISNLCAVQRVDDFISRITEINVAGGYFKLEVTNSDPNYSYQYAVVEVTDLDDCSFSLAQGSQNPNQVLTLTVYTNFQTTYGYLDLGISVNVVEQNNSLTRHMAGTPWINWY